MINVNSFQSLGAVDGPGVRFVVFLQGCNLKCSYCHNPETLAFSENNLYTEEMLFEKIDRYSKYIKESGGVTFSGGEPLLQAKALLPLFKRLKENGYHIAVDTNGTVLNEDVQKLLCYVDLVLLDVKMPNDDLYVKYIGTNLENVMNFLDYLDKNNIDTWIRQVVIEGVNDTDENISFLNSILRKKCVKKAELLPFKKICVEKYKSMNLKFPMEDFKETDIEIINRMKNELLK